MLKQVFACFLQKAGFIASGNEICLPQLVESGLKVLAEWRKVAIWICTHRISPNQKYHCSCDFRAGDFIGTCLGLQQLAGWHERSFYEDFMAPVL